MRTTLLPSMPPLVNAPNRADLIRTHYDFQKGAFLTEWEETPDWIRVFSEVSALPMWNHAAWIGSESAAWTEFLKQTRASWPKPARRPVVYRIKQPGTKWDPLEEGFERCDQESWMWYARAEPPPLERPEVLDIRLAGQEGEFSDFLAVFCAAYGAREGQYRGVFRPASGDGETGCRTVHYVAYAQGEPVCIATLISRGTLACIYNVGTSPRARKQGFAARLMVHLLRDALAAGHTGLFLQAETGGSAERLYARLGFATAFVRTGYRLADWSSRPAPERQNRTRASDVPAQQFLAAIYREDSPVELKPEHAMKTVPLPTGLLDEVKLFSARNRVQEETLWVAGWAMVLSRYSHETQVCFGLRSAGEQAEPRLVGVEVPEDRPVASWLGELNRNTALRESEAGAFESVIDLRAASMPGGTTRKTSASLEWRLHRPAGGRLDLIYDRSRFQPESVDRLAGHLVTGMASLLKHPLRKVASVEMLTPAELEQLLVDWNCPRPPALTSPWVQRLFEAQVSRSPQTLAIILASATEPSASLSSLTYAELDRRANQLAHYLLRLGLAAKRVVAVHMERSLDMIVAVLAVFKAGGICLPLDTTSPKHRLELILADANATIVLGQSRSRAALPASNARFIDVDAEAASIEAAPTEVLISSNAPDDPAYVIYTSGSTGQPKGVLISHQALASHCLEARTFYELRPEDRVLQFNSLSFDAAFEQIFTTLITGAALVVRGPEVWSAKEFSKRIEADALTVADVPTAYWHQLLQEWVQDRRSAPRRWPRLCIVGGEAMSPHSLDLWRQLPIQDVRLINAYGPTEATITATAFELSPEFLTRLPRRTPIGRLRGDRTAYVLDGMKRLVPMGVPGELHLGGPLLALGYLNRPELTRQKFIPDPFRAGGRERLYRTGDLVRYLPDGNLEFLGRVDQQVKIRGFRVELGEIEAALQQHTNVRECAIILRESNEHSHLAAYIVAKELPAPSAGEFREFLHRKLPDYMVPARFVALDKLPLLPSGKIDRRALPEAAPSPPTQSATGPRDAMELRLQLLFERILRQRGVGVDVSFFELGGDSLQALELIVEIERMSGRTLPLGTLYQMSSVQALAKLLQDQPASTEWTPLVPLQTGGSRPPLFLVHTTPGDILGYGNLIYHLDPGQPCYGLESLGLVRPEAAHRRIEDMASYYLGLVRSLQPGGPYYLAGWCYGGIVALEMAQQLAADGEKVAFLGLLETVAPAPRWRVYSYYLHRFACLLRMSPRQWWCYFGRKITYYHRVRLANKMRFRRLEKGEGSNPELLDDHNRKLAKLEQIYTANLAALKSYRPKPYPGRVTLFNAAVVDPGVIADPLYAWPGLAEDIAVHVVPGDHDTMLMEPNVAVLAQQLNAALLGVQRATKPVASVTETASAWCLG